MDKIYKYRDQGAGTIKLLQNFELYFNEPKNFNDPFDSFIEYDFSGSYSEWEKYLNEIGLPPPDIKNALDMIRSGSFNPSSSALQSSQLKISCFSEEPDNMLLWSHYAKDHQGVCIGFKLYDEFESQCMHLDPKDLNPIHSKVPKGIIPLSKVNYQLNMPTSYNRLKDDNNRLMEFVTTKSLNWEYEKEYRAILNSHLVINNPIHFSPYEITDIIFGINTEEVDKNKIRSIVSNYPKSGNWISFYQCQRSKGQYKISLHKL